MLEILPNDFITILLAVVIGGIIGAEREYMDKHVGFRTMICVCLGAALFTLFSVKFARYDADPARIASGIVSGVGFLGAAAIIGSEGRTRGFTTAVAVWLVAALGIGIGGGFYKEALFGAVVVFVILAIFPKVENFIDSLNEIRVYKIVFEEQAINTDELSKSFAKEDLKIIKHKHMKRNQQQITEYIVKGSVSSQDRMLNNLLNNSSIRDLTY